VIFWASLILLLPFLVLHWLVPLFSDLTLGNDYAVFHIQQQMELMFSLKMGVFPLYVPGFAGGHSYAALTLGQIFHPISQLAAALPGYWDGKALELNTLLRLLSLGGCHFMLFYFLRSLKLESAMAFVLSFITVYNMRMLDLFRYGAALESWTGFIFVCTFIGLQIRFPDKWFYRLATIGSTYWLVCSGHPQMMYYGLLGVGIFALMAPYYIGIFTGEKPVTSSPVCKVYGRIIFCLVAGVLLSAPYILSFHYEFLTTNARRVVQGYAWADDYRDTVAGTINNFVFPLRSDFHSAFGSAILFLPAIIIPSLRLMRIRIPTVIWAAWGLVIFLLLHSLGDRLPIHYLTWKYVPFASSVRIAGRILMIAPFFLMLIMVWLASDASGKITIGKRLPATPALSAMSLLAVILIGVWVYLPVTITADIAAFSAYSVRSVPFWAENAITLAGVVLLLWFVLKPFYKRFAFSTAVCFCALLCLQVTLLLQFGTWIQKAEETPKFDRMLRHKQEKLTYRNATGYGMASTVVLKQVENAYLEPYLGKLYSRWVTAIDNDDAYDLMKKGRTPDTVIVEAVDATLPENHPGKLIRGSVKLTFSSFNRLVFDVNSSQMGLFGLSYPFNKKWRVSVNDRETVQYRANGASMAVVVPKGSSCVEFQYHSPATFWGMVIFFSSMSVLLIVFAGPRCHRSWHYLTLAIGLLICGGCFYLWNHSLYTGDNLATEYFWETKPAGDRPNLAYSKESHMIANLYSHYPYLYTSGQAVDGKRDFGDGFVTDRKKQPWWFVDLYTPEKIAEIHIYERERSGFLKKYPTNKRPLRIMFSTDGDRWQEAAIITESEHARPLKIEVDPPMKARYVMLQASGSCYLAIDEIEVYPPPKIEMMPEKSEAHLSSLSDKDPDV
jgi:hypothetical protein